MKNFKDNFAFFLLFAVLGGLSAQNKIGSFPSEDSLLSHSEYRLPFKKLIIPATFITYGALSLWVKPLHHLNISTQHEILQDHDHRSHLDSYAQFVPGVAVYVLNNLGVNGKHNLMDRTILLAGSELISTMLVLPLKHIVKERRPDGSGNLSFPSGHSATAFSMAQFMFLEYKDTNIWVALSGYPFALFTASYRVINNRHWVGDVVEGAGIGILSTEVAYWLYPKFRHWFGTDKPNGSATLFLPAVTNKTIGVVFQKNF